MKPSQLLRKYRITSVEYEALVWFGEHPYYIKELEIGNRRDTILASCIYKLIKKGFFSFDRPTKKVTLTEKGQEVWNYKDPQSSN